MVVDEYGRVGFTQQEIVDHLKINPNFDLWNLGVVDGEQYESARIKTNLDVPEIVIWNQRDCSISTEEYHWACQQVWLIPDEYKNLDIQSWLRNQCKTLEELDRVNSELVLYRKFDLLTLLQYLKYLRDLADKNGIVIGVGRGSSCASYCLYLMKIHQVNSLFFHLDISEFLRE